MAESPQSTNNASPTAELPGLGKSSPASRDNVRPAAASPARSGFQNDASPISGRAESPASHVDAAQSLPSTGELLPHRRDVVKKKTTFILQQHIHSDKETASFLAEFSQAADAHSKKQLLIYDLRKLIQVGGLFSMFCSGSVFRMDTAWAADAVNVVIVAVISAFIANALGVQSLDIFANLMDQASQLVPVVLGLYVAMCFDRWWQLREEALGNIFMALTDVAMAMACAVPDDEGLQEDIARLGLASIELLIKAARVEPDFESCLVKGLLTPEEVSTLEPMDAFQRVVALWAWILRLSTDALNDKGPRAAELHKLCLKAREGILRVQMSRCAQLPFAYVHVQAWLVSAHNMIVAVRVGLGVASAWVQGSYDACVGQLFIGSVICVIYRGVLCITHLIHDPFGPAAMGFPINAYTGYVAASLSALQMAGKNCPAVERLRIAETGCTRV